MKTRICVSTYGKTLEELVKSIKEITKRYGNILVEARVDYLEEDINAATLAERLKPYAERLVITVRPAEEGGYYTRGEDKRLLLIRRLALIQPAYIDVELNKIDNSLIQNIRNLGVKVIVSWHDFKKTPPRRDLTEVAKRAINLGDVAKVVTMSRGVEDNLNILYLYSMLDHRRLIAFCMGEQGRVTRILSATAGAPIIYAATPDKKTAPGQYSVDEILDILKWPICSAGAPTYEGEK